MGRYLFGILLVSGVLAGSAMTPAPVSALADHSAQTTQPPPTSGTPDCGRKKPEPQTS